MPAAKNAGITGHSLLPALALTLLFLTSLCERARALTIDSFPDALEFTGTHASLAVVDGRPAIAWAAGNFKSVKYARALDGAGVAWGPHVVVDMGENTGHHVRLVVADGKPAVCYVDVALGKLRYARALDAQGSAWGDPVVLETGPSPPAGLTMEMVGGMPAVCYATGEGLKYLRASDARGLAWGAVQTLDSTVTGNDLSMKVVQGFPAVAYGRAVSPLVGAVFYIRALDGAGAAWSPPRQTSGLYGASRPLAPCLEEVSGLPAIVWGSAFPSGDDVEYWRAVDAEGSGWTLGRPPRLLWGTGTPGLAVISGRPAIATLSANESDLMFRHAQTPTGEGDSAWPLPVQVDSPGTVGLNPILREVNGLPAIVYLNVSRKTLEYVRATAAGPSFRWPAQLQVTTPGQTDPVIPGTTHDFGIVSTGQVATVVFDLYNPNASSEALKVTNCTLEGPDAAEFSLQLSRTPPYTLPPAGGAGGSASILVKCQPLTPGEKNVVLRIQHDGNPSPFTIAFTADTNPILELTPPGRKVGGGYQLDFPPAHPGRPQEFVFSVRNTGGAQATNLAVNFDGPDAAEFSVAQPPPAVLPPQQSATFTVRHETLTIGAKTANLRVAGSARGILQVTLRLIAGVQDTAFTAEDEPVACLAVQPDGKILTGGSTVRRLLPDGAQDTSFFSPAIVFQMGISGVKCVAVQRDGRILAGGAFEKVNGQVRGPMVRLLPDGSLDETFAPAGGGTVFCMAIQPDGKILAGGAFGPIPGGGPPVLARLHEDGTVDASFHPVITDGYVLCLALQPDGKILAGGSLKQGMITWNLLRLNSDGALDRAFPTASLQPLALALLPDGRVLAGGEGGGTGGLRHYLPDGTPDAGDMADGPVWDLAMQADGACLVTGAFLSVGGQLHQDAVRLRSAGTVDSGFDTLFENAGFRRVALQTDGGVLLAGEGRGSVAAPDAIVRLGNDPAVSALQRDATSQTVRWLRGGTAPAVTYVSFDVRPAGAAAWTPLGFGVPVAGGWELEVSGPALPARGTLRAWGPAGGSLIEAVADILPPLETWRLTHFHSPDATGDAANDADPDNDGLTNFVEFAFGSSPVDRSDRHVPAFELAPGANGYALTAAFTAPPGRENIRYAAEQSNSLLPGTWTDIPDTGSGDTHTFRAAPDPNNGTGRVFVRFVVSLRPE